MRLTLVLEDEVTPSLNVLMRKYRHPMARKRLRERYGWLLLTSPGWEANVAVSGPQRRKVTIVSYRRNTLDDDNLAGGCKVLIDALRDVRLIWEDSPKFLEVGFRQEIDRRRPRTEILVEGAPDA